MLSRRNRSLLFVLTPYPAYPIRESSCVAFAFFFFFLLRFFLFLCLSSLHVFVSISSPISALVRDFNKTDH